MTAKLNATTILQILQYHNARHEFPRTARSGFLRSMVNIPAMSMGRNRTTDARIFRPRSVFLGLNNQPLAALASPDPTHPKANLWHTQSESGIFLPRRLNSRAKQP
jgi:hypothetical protein